MIFALLMQLVGEPTVLAWICQITLSHLTVFCTGNHRGLPGHAQCHLLGCTLLCMLQLPMPAEQRFLCVVRRSQATLITSCLMSRRDGKVHQAEPSVWMATANPFDLAQPHVI